MRCGLEYVSLGHFEKRVEKKSMRSLPGSISKDIIYQDPNLVPNYLTESSLCCLQTTGSDGRRARLRVEDADPDESTGIVDVMFDQPGTSE